jgi:hypothetical protein
MQTVFDFYADPGHGWAKVPARVLAELDFAPWDFTGYSYVGRDCLYLEEDCDLSRFVVRYKERTGREPQWRDHYSNSRSRIRSKPSNVWTRVEMEVV